jgi:hypothetical protein
VLSRYGEDILSGWLENARKQPFHAMRPEGAVADHIPALFAALVAMLRRTSARWLDTPPALADPAVLDAAQSHARVRFERDSIPMTRWPSFASCVRR